MGGDIHDQLQLEGIVCSSLLLIPYLTIRADEVHAQALPADLYRGSYWTPTPHPSPIASWDKFRHDSYLLAVKGAPDVLLPRCESVLNPLGGKPIPLDGGVRERIVSVQEQWAAQGRRVILLARRVVRSAKIPPKMDTDSEEFEELVNELNSELIIVGFVGLIDSLKPDIAETVRICRGAGIRFFVVTGEKYSS